MSKQLTQHYSNIIREYHDEGLDGWIRRLQNTASIDDARDALAFFGRLRGKNIHDTLFPPSRAEREKEREQRREKQKAAIALADQTERGIITRYSLETIMHDGRTIGDWNYNDHTKAGIAHSEFKSRLNADGSNVTRDVFNDKEINDIFQRNPSWKSATDQKELRC